MLSRTLAVVALFAMSGCATIFSGGPQNVSVNSNPAGAKAVVMIDGAVFSTVTTPSTVKLDKGKNVIIEVSADGYMPARVTLEKSMSGWFIVSIATLDPVAVVVDLWTGAYVKYDDQLLVSLTKAAAGGAPVSQSSADERLYAAIEFRDARTGRPARAMLPLVPTAH